MGVFLLVLVLLFSWPQYVFSIGGFIYQFALAYRSDLWTFCMPRPPAVLDPENFILLGRATKARSFRVLDIGLHGISF